MDNNERMPSSGILHRVALVRTDVYVYIILRSVFYGIIQWIILFHFGVIQSIILC
jgi:hypothetical protein